MALILAIEPDKKQASAVRALARGSLNAQMLVADSTSHGLQQLDGRIPDLILTSLLLSPKDEHALDEHLHGLDAEGHRVPTLVIPVLGPLSRSKGGLLTRLKKPKKTTGTEGCDPATFAAQITEYLDRAAAERALDEPDDDDPPIAARSRRTSIVAGGRQVSDPIPAAFDAVASFDSDPTFAKPAPEPVRTEPVLPEPILTEKILKDPFSTEGLVRPVERRMDAVPIEPEVAFEESLDGVPLDETRMPAAVHAHRADEDDTWDEIAIDTNDASLDITAEPIDLNTFVEELEAIVSSFGKTSASDRRRDALFADPPIGLSTRYAWPALEGLPAGTDWETTAPGDPDYEVLAEFMAAFEAPTAVLGSRSARAVPIEIVVVDPEPAPRAVDRNSGISLAMRQRYSWPPLEGIECVDLLAEIEPDEAGLYSFADPEPPPLASASLGDPPTPQAGALVEATVHIEPAVKPAARVESAVRPAVRIEPAVKAAVRIEPVVKPAVRVEPASRPAPAALPVTNVSRIPPSRANEIAAAVVPDPPAAPAPSAAPAQWLEILSAIRRDIQELRAEHRTELVAEREPESTEAGASGVARAKGAPPATADDSSARPASAKTRKPQAAATPPKPGRRRKRVAPPKQDEWGFFDPDQCGFAALLAKLEEIEGDEPTTPEQS